MQHKINKHPPRRTLKLDLYRRRRRFYAWKRTLIQSGWVTKEDWILMPNRPTGRDPGCPQRRTWYEITVSHRAHTASCQYAMERAKTLLPPWRRSFMRSVPRSKTRRHIRISVSPRSHLGRSRAVIVRMSFRNQCKLWIDMRLVPPLCTEQTNRIVQQAIENTQTTVPESMLPTRSPETAPYVEKDEHLHY